MQCTAIATRDQCKRDCEMYTRRMKRLGGTAWNSREGPEFRAEASLSDILVHMYINMTYWPLES